MFSGNFSHLTSNLRTTYDLLLTGKSEKQIAAELMVSVHIVHKQVKQIYRKMGVNSRAELMAQRLQELTNGNESVAVPAALDQESLNSGLTPSEPDRTDADIQLLFQEATRLRQEFRDLADVSRGLNEALERSVHRFQAKVAALSACVASSKRQSSRHPSAPLDYKHDDLTESCAA